jgi:hypothetical protein
MGKPVNQPASKQINCLVDLGAALDYTNNRLWEMKNSYVLASHSALVEISKRLRAAKWK